MRKMTKKNVAVFWGLSLAASHEAVGLLTFRTREEARRVRSEMTDTPSSKGGLTSMSVSRPFKIYVEV